MLRVMSKAQFLEALEALPASAVFKLSEVDYKHSYMRPTIMEDASFTPPDQCECTFTIEWSLK